MMRGMARIYVTGHRSPDTDSIASAVGYAELKGRLDPRNDYVPVRLGELNAQTRWVLERSGASEPQLLRHVLLRARDVMRERFPRAADRDPVREVGLIMARDDVDLVPVVDGDGRLAGAVTERALARRYVRESREASRAMISPTSRTGSRSAARGKRSRITSRARSRTWRSSCGSLAPLRSSTQRVWAFSSPSRTGT